MSCLQDHKGSHILAAHRGSAILAAHRGSAVLAACVINPIHYVHRVCMDPMIHYKKSFRRMKSYSFYE